MGDEWGMSVRVECEGCSQLQRFCTAFTGEQIQTTYVCTVHTIGHLTNYGQSIH